MDEKVKLVIRRVEAYLKRRGLDPTRAWALASLLLRTGPPKVVEKQSPGTGPKNSLPTTGPS